MYGTSESYPYLWSLCFFSAGVEVPYLLSMDFVEETANFCKALADAITQREAAFGHFDVAHGHEWCLDHWNMI